MGSHRPNPWWVGVVAGMASYIDAAAIVANGIALVIYQETIGVTPGQIGVLSAALTFCIAIGALSGGRLGDRFGRRRVFLATMALIVAGSALLTFSTVFPLLFAGIVLVGLGVGADLPVSLATIAESASGQNRGAILGLSNILWSVGILSAIVISSVAGGWGRLGGQLLYAQVGVVALVLLVLRLGIPESDSWLRAGDERRGGVHTVRADKVSIRDLIQPPYGRPLLALLLFYALTNLAANTAGQFNTYIAANIAGVEVEVFNRVALLAFPVGLLAGVWFMRVVDTPRRMPYFAAGAVLLVIGYLVPAVLGFTLTTMGAGVVLTGIGGAFAFEGIMKVWTQESFPTMLRSSAQGTIVAFARITAALLALVTPALLDAGARAFYLVLALLVAVGLLIGWREFHGHTHDEFTREAERAGT
ncbi:MFS transporter [Actinoplanes sp. NBC_00393]|uniref:MFS transporter n=1 Tax=Actinoplanes sp. NBC_00393 TaxID=2975953 RepID=UPI002E1A94F8